ncbi:hypothetical protein Dda_1804 [Drechslerella dactyloides]|uniref:Uncharacterized protein n=1 Tax=Drechslerella dactyloides TaxID=74499 RepID=A0AAD6NND6_DREDA|nr:hypothetical protein Dda_1804 [Drechslerella dactyloides]
MRQNLLLHSLLYLAASIGFSEATCNNSDNCAKAVRGAASNKADCSSFMAATYVVSTVTSTVTARAGSGNQEDAEAESEPVTKTVVEKAMVKQKPNRFRRGVPPGANIVTATAIPNGVRDECTVASQYASACACWGITKSTVTVSAITVTVTKTAAKAAVRPQDDDEESTTIVATTTVTGPPITTHTLAAAYKAPPKCTREEELCDGACKNLHNDCEHCGDCGIKCKKGAVCVNGVCSEPACKGVAAWGCRDKKMPGCNGQPGEDCFCVQSGKVGFCATYATLPMCPEAMECTKDEECPITEICGYIACCGKKRICIAPHGSAGDVDGLATCGNGVAPSRLFRKTKSRNSAKPDSKSQSEPTPESEEEEED